MAGAYYGDPGQQNTGIEDILPLFHAVRDRNMQDYKDKAAFDSDLAIRQENSRRVFDPNRAGTSLSTVGGGGGRTTNPDISMGLTAPNPEIATNLKEDLTPQDKAKFGLEKSSQDIERSKIAQQGKLGEEALGIKTAQEKLNQEKSENIHQTKLSQQELEHQRDMNNLGAKYDKMAADTSNVNNRLDFLHTQLEVTNNMHKRENDIRDATQKSNDALNQAKIDNLRKQYQDSVKSIGYEYAEDGKTLIKQTQQSGKVPTDKNPAFKSSTTYKMTDKDGKSWMVSDENKAAAIKAGMTEAKQ